MAKKVIGSYELLDELTTKNAGFSRWGFCKKDGHEYFIKEFLTPVYPIEQGPLSESQFNRKRDICNSYYTEQNTFYDVLRKCRTGNNVIIEDFFRHNSRYYVVTDKVAAPRVSIAQIADYDRDKKEVLIRSVLYSMAALHDHRIIHADIKPDNILTISTQNGYCTAKIIDFDSGFMAYNQPQDVTGDQVYFAPETYLRLSGEDVELTDRIDIFALGILFHQYWSGSLPKINGEQTYVCEAVLNDTEVILSKNIPADIREMIQQMLSKEPSKRPSARELLEKFSEKDCSRKVPVKPVYPDPVEPPPQKEPSAPTQTTRKSFYIPDDLG